MEPSSKIYVAGHRGMVGAAILRNLAKHGYDNIILRTRTELDLSDPAAVDVFFNQEKPDVVINAAARVGGIYANSTYPAEFIHENLASAHNLVHSAWRQGTKRLLFLGSSCIYPREAPQPIKEEYLLSSPLEPTNEAYAIAKIAGLKLCQYYRQQYFVMFHSAMPTNLYGPNDNYHPENSHVIPALLRRFHEAKVKGDNQVVLWGTGKPKREFLHADDLAEGVFQLLHQENPPDIVNIGCGQDVTIRELAEIIKEVVQFEGKLLFDTEKPDGTPRKLLDITKLFDIGWRPTIDLKSGLESTYKHFLEEQASGALRQ